MTAHKKRALAVKKAGFKVVVNERAAQVLVYDRSRVVVHLADKDASNFLDRADRVISAARESKEVARRSLAYDLIQSALQRDFGDFDESFYVNG